MPDYPQFCFLDRLYRLLFDNSAFLRSGLFLHPLDCCSGRAARGKHDRAGFAFLLQNRKSGSVYLDLNFFVSAACSRTHNDSYCLCDSALLADNSADIVLGDAEMINGDAVLIYFVNRDAYFVGILDKAFCKTFK